MDIWPNTLLQLELEIIKCIGFVQDAKRNIQAFRTRLATTKFIDDGIVIGEDGLGGVQINEIIDGGIVVDEDFDSGLEIEEVINEDIGGIQIDEVVGDKTIVETNSKFSLQHYHSRYGDVVPRRKMDGLHDVSGMVGKLTVVDYFVNDNLFKHFIDDEKESRHSCEFVVQGGLFYMPGISGDPLPLGLPQVAITLDGQRYDHLSQDTKELHKHEVKRPKSKPPDHAVSNMSVN